MGNSGYKKINDIMYIANNKIVVPTSKRHDIKVHENAVHPGVNNTINLIKDNYHWPDLDKDVSSFESECEKCFRRKVNKTLAQAEMHSVTATEPLEIIALDFIGERSRTSNGNTHILMSIDIFTRYIEATATNAIDAKTIAKFVINNIFCRYGAPRRLLTDNGSGFTSNFMKEISKTMEISCTQATLYNSKGNGTVGRANRTIQDKIAPLTTNGAEWDEILPLATFACNISITT